MKTNDKHVKQIATAAFPEYTGRKFFLEIQNRPIDMRSCWEDGSCEYFRFVSLANGRASKKVSGLGGVVIPEGFVAVRRTISRGIECGLTVIANPANMTKLLAAKEK